MEQALSRSRPWRLNDLPRSGKLRKLNEEKIKEILRLTTQRVPREAAHWSLRLMAKYAGGPHLASRAGVGC
ncbi:hypothetical protein D3C85_1659250 [compost metagenome]